MNNVEQTMQQVRAHLHRAYNLDPDKIDALLPGFLSALTEYADTLENALAGNETGALAKAAHRLKGGLANLGLQELAREAQLIEQEARHGEKAGKKGDPTGQALELLEQVRALAAATPRP